MSISIRVNSTLTKYMNGIDYALWYNFKELSDFASELDIDLDTHNGLTRTQGKKITFSNKNSQQYLALIGKQTGEKNNKDELSRNEILHRLLFWLSSQNDYPKNFKE